MFKVFWYNFLGKLRRITNFNSFSSVDPIDMIMVVGIVDHGPERIDERRNLILRWSRSFLGHFLMVKMVKDGTRTHSLKTRGIPVRITTQIR